jgi:hypothetical protein
VNAVDALQTFCMIVGAAGLIVLACVLVLAVGETLADIRDRRAAERDLVRELDQGVPADWTRKVSR